MPSLPGINHLDAIRALQKAGFRVARQGKHTVMSKEGRIITIPRHNPIHAYTMGASSAMRASRSKSSRIYSDDADSRSKLERDRPEGSAASGSRFGRGGPRRNEANRQQRPQQNKPGLGPRRRPPPGCVDTRLGLDTCGRPAVGPAMRGAKLASRGSASFCGAILDGVVAGPSVLAL
jgi:predicted RNA binding protein YcfA (HicA-like mRNA interferase family)